MKKSLLALAVLGAFAGAASAQSSVTVYGLIDAGINSTNLGNTAPGVSGHTVGITSGGETTSRIGFKGTEDLGGGLSALFQLEAGLNIDTGSFSTTQGAAYPGSATSTSTFFNRVSVVGLSGGFGTVKVGRQTTVLKDAGDIVDPFGQTGSLGNLERIFYFAGAPTTGLVSAANLSGQIDGGRVSNTIKYSTPSFSGFSGQVGYTFGEQAGSAAANGQTGLGLAYVNGPLNIQFGYQHADITGASPVFGNGAVTGFANIASTQTAFLGGVYDFGVLKLHAAYADNRADATGSFADPKSKNGLIGVTVPFGASTVKASYAVNNNDTSGVSQADSQQFAIEYDYDLSKRTNLYTGYARTSNDANANLGGANGYATTSVLGGSTVTVLNVGVRHKF